MGGTKKNGAEVLDSRVVYNNRGLIVKEEQFKVPGVTDTKTYRFCDMKSSIRIVAITEKNEVVLIEEFKYPVDEFVLSLPAGSVEEGEIPQVAGERELKEETGYTAKSFEDLGSYYPMAGTIRQEAKVILARNSYRCDSQNPDEYERVSIRKIELISLPNIFDAVKEDKLK